MKIASQTADQIVLKDSNYKGIVIACGFILVGIILSFGIAANPQIWNIIGTWAVILLIAFYTIFTSPSFLIVIDKSSGAISYHMKRIILSKNDTYQIINIVRIEWRKMFRRSGKGTQIVTQSVIVFKDGSEMPLEGKKAENGFGFSVILGGNSSADNKDISLSKQIADFIGVPLQEVEPTPSGIELPGGIQI
jgi:hypothetical protein